MSKELSARLMKLTLWLLAGYFFLIALAHITSTKLPLFFVYFDVPSNAYQDNIISFFAFGWAVFFATIARARHGSESLAFIRAVLLVAVGAVAGLVYNTATTDFAAFSPEITVWPYWVQTGILGAIALWILFLYTAIARAR